MDDLKKEFAAALRREIANAGSQTALAKKIGVQQSRISDYLTGRYDFSNMTIGTLAKFFPECRSVFRMTPPPPRWNRNWKNRCWNFSAVCPRRKKPAM
ncbi:MAG: helix-turn-helix transcriptional regulator [Lentisphaeria bacterium]|nr:helix-turn-helix transcriptional regulator [Lentisphaeria bacterium]